MKKVYIGQSIDIKKRKDQYKNLNSGVQGQPKIYNSIQKYGFENHRFEIIEECFIEQLNEREIYWGLYYNVLGKNGLNLRLGNGRGKISEELKIQISNKHKGMKKPWAGSNMKITEEHKVKLIHARKNTINIIFQYDLKGNFIKEWLNPKQAAIELNINNGYLHTILDTEKTLGGFKFTKIKHDGVSSTTKWAKNKKSVLQYDLEGNFIKEWESAKEAAKTLNYKIQNITSCCRGEHKTSYKSIWKYAQA